MDERWIWAGAALAGGIIAGAIAGLFLRRLFDREDRRPALREIASPLSLFAFWVLTATGIVLAIAVSSPETLRPLPREILDWLPNVAVAGLLVIGGYALALTVAAAVGQGVIRASGFRQRTIERAVRSAVFGGAMILALSQLGVDTTVLNILIGGLVFGTASGLAGIAIVGARSVAGHIAAGRSLHSALTIGTEISVGELSGVVVEAQIAHVVLRTDTGPVLLPYGAIIDEPIHLLAAAEAGEPERA